MLKEYAVTAAIVPQPPHSAVQRPDLAKVSDRIFDQVVLRSEIVVALLFHCVPFADVNCVQECFGAFGQYGTQLWRHDVRVREDFGQFVFNSANVHDVSVQQFFTFKVEARQAVGDFTDFGLILGLKRQAVALFCGALLVSRRSVCEPTASETKQASQQRFPGPINKAISGNNADCDTSEQGADQGDCFIYFWYVHHGTLSKRLIVLVSTAGSATSSYLKGAA